MPSPSAIELYGDPKPIPLNQLLDEKSVYQELAGKGKQFECQEKLIDNRLQITLKNIPPSTRDLWKACGKAFAHRDYIVSQDERYKYGDVLQQSLQVAHWLSSRFQVRKGDRVGIAARNWPEFVTSFWAIHLLGAVSCLLNSFNDGDTLAYCVRDVGCRVVIVDGERYERIESHLSTLQTSTAESEGLHAVVVMPRIKTRKMTADDKKKWKDKNGVFDWEELMKESANVKEAPSVKIEADDNALILFTSGTTGKPKGVISTQRQLLSSIRLSPWGLARSLTRRRRPLPEPAPPESHDQRVFLILVPLMHVTGLLSGLVTQTSVGGRVCLMPNYEKKTAATIAAREKATSILGVGWMMREISDLKMDLSSVQIFSHGGASSAKELPSELLQRNPKSVSSNGYGLTETNGVAAIAFGDEYHANPTSVGKPVIGCELIIVDPESGVKLPSGEKGELWIRSPGIAKGYWNRPRDTAESFLPDGWFRTGDIAYIDKDGFIFVVDRMKDIIVRGGENVSSGQVENAVFSHPDVTDCAVVAIPEPQLGERVAVVCIVKEGSKAPSKEDIVAAAAKTLPKYCLPEYVWIRTEPLERNASGKILKADVKAAVIKKAKEEGWKASSREAKL